MTKQLTLLLIRHCKSDWSAGSDDHERPLNPRGERDAPRLGAWLQVQDLMPGQVLCSDAMRTRLTWDGIAQGLTVPTDDITFARALYLADPTAIRAEIDGATAQTLAVIGHAPGLPTLAWNLAMQPPAQPEFAAYPTGAITAITFKASSWAGITRGDVIAFTTPKLLPSG